MMLYTVISEYDIFYRNFRPRSYMNIKGGKLEYTGTGRNKTVVGLFSTDPAMYLNKNYQPGRRIKTK